MVLLKGVNMFKHVSLGTFSICIILALSFIFLGTSITNAKPCHKRVGKSISPKVAKDGVGTSCRKKEAIHLAKKAYYAKNCDNMPNCVTQAKCKVWKKKENNQKVVVSQQVSCDGFAKQDGGKVKITKAKDETCKEITGRDFILADLLKLNMFSNSSK